MNRNFLFSLFAMLLIVAGTANAENVTFNTRSWSEENKEVVTRTDTKNCAVLEGDHSEDWIDLDNGYYVARGGVNYKVLNIVGSNVHLILEDGATLYCKHVKLETGHSLSIFSQSDGESQGKLIADNTDYKYAAGIGGGDEATSGTNGKLLNAFTGFYTFTQGSEPTVITTLVALEISDTQSNDQKIESYDGANANVRYTGRTFYKNDGWYTICLPFDLPTNLAMFDGAEVYTLESSNYESSEKKLTLNFTDMPDIMEAGTPYLVRWQDDESGEVQLDFGSVVIKNIHQSISTDHADFVGSFSPVTLNEDDNSVLYLGAENKLYYPTRNIKMGACRAYFKLKGLTVSDLETKMVNTIVLNLGDDSTGITTLSMESGKEGASTTGWHTLDGRRLNSKPTQPGLYIQGGRKVVIK